MYSVNLAVRINKPSEFWVIVSGFEVVKPSLSIEVVAPVAYGVDAGHRAGGGEYLAMREPLNASVTF